MLSLFDSMAAALAATNFVRDLADEAACRAHLNRMGWGVDRFPPDILRAVMARAAEYRRLIP